MIRRSIAIRHFLLRLAPAHSSVEGGSREARTICEVTDIVDYFLVNDRPSGIQRVQIELIRAVQSDSPKNLRFTCFRDQTEDWIEIGEGLLALIVLFLSAGDAALPSDIETVRRFVQAEQAKAQPFQVSGWRHACDFGRDLGAPSSLVRRSDAQGAARSSLFAVTL